MNQSKRQITLKGLEDVERRAQKTISRYRGAFRFLSPEATQAAATLVMAQEVRRLWEKESFDEH